MSVALATVLSEITEDLCWIDQTLQEHLSNVYLNCDCIIRFINQILFDADKAFNSVFPGETAAKRVYYFNVETLQFKQGKVKLFSDMIKAVMISAGMNAETAISHQPHLWQASSVVSSWRVTPNVNDPTGYMVAAQTFIDNLIGLLNDDKDSGAKSLSASIDGSILSSERVMSAENAQMFHSTESKVKRGICIKRANLMQRWDLIKQCQLLKCAYEAKLPEMPHQHQHHHHPAPSLTNEAGAGGTSDCDTALQGAYTTDTWKTDRRL